MCPLHGRHTLLQVQECTKAGGVYKVKFDTTGRFLHVFWMTAEQVGEGVYVYRLLFFHGLGRIKVTRSDPRYFKTSRSDPTRPVNFENLAVRPDPALPPKFRRPFDLIRLDPRDVGNCPGRTGHHP